MNEEILAEKRINWRDPSTGAFGVWITYHNEDIQVASCGQEPPEGYEELDEKAYYQECLARLHQSQQDYYEQQRSTQVAAEIAKGQRGEDVGLLVGAGIPERLAEQLVPSVSVPPSVPFGQTLDGIRPFLATTYRLPADSIDSLLAEVGGE